MSYIKYELYSDLRQNYWTGLRQPVNDNIAGRNWMTYYCMLRKTKYNTPMDGIMFIINDFLNWIPAGCWYANIYNSCTQCKCSYWIKNIKIFPSKYCSYQCMEKNIRYEINEDRQKFIMLMNLFKYSPIDAIEEGINIINNIYEYYDVDEMLTECWYDNSDTESIDMDDYYH